MTNGNSNSAIVDNGAFSNPVRITVAEVPTYTKLATPDPSTFRASNISETSFIASWSAIKNAKYYDVKVRKVGGSYEQADFNGGTMGTSLEITGLQPGTSYQFQVRARNDNPSEKGNWSGSSVVNIRTKNVGTVMANLSVFKVDGISNGESLTLGDSRYLQIYVANNGSAPWEGALSLKEGTQEIKSWTNFQISKGAAKPVEYIYVPKTTGSKLLTLYYKTQNTSGESPIDANSAASNPIKVNVIADKSIYDGLQLKSAISCPNTLETANTYTLSAIVINKGNDEWTGTLSIVVDGIEMSSKQVTMSSKYGEVPLTAAWTPQTAGTHVISVDYKENSSSNRYQVGNGAFTNPLSVEVKNVMAQGEVQKAFVKALSKNLAPEEITVGSQVFYHFKITDEKGNPIQGAIIQFICTGSSLKNIVSSLPSDGNGLSTLCINTEGKDAIGARGETVKIKSYLLKSSSGKKILYSFANNDDFVSLRVHKGNAVSNATGFENLESFKITLKVGATVEGEVAPLRGGINAEASISCPLSIAFKYDKSTGALSKVSNEIGAEVKVGGKLEFGDWFTWGGGLKGTWKTTQTYNTSKPWNTTLATILDLLSVTKTYMNSTTLLCVNALESWYLNKFGDLLRDPIIEPEDCYKSSVYGVNTNCKIDILKALPAGIGKLTHYKCVPYISFLDKFTVSGDAAFTYEPNKKRFKNGSWLYGSNRNMKVELAGEVDVAFGEISSPKSALWKRLLGSEITALNKISKVLQESKTAGKLSFAFKTTEEEMYTNENKNKLAEISNSVELETAAKLSTDDLTKFIPVDWLKPKTSFSLSFTNSYMQKITGKGEFLNHLEILTDNHSEYRDLAGKIFPVFVSTGIIANPWTHYKVWKGEESLNALRRFCNGEKYDLNDVKVTTQYKGKVDGEVSIPIARWDLGWWGDFDITFDTSLGFEGEWFPSEVYYSSEDGCFLPVVSRPVSSWNEICKSITSYIRDKISNLFSPKDKEEINEEHKRLGKRWEVENRNTAERFTNKSEPHAINSRALRIRSKHPMLVEQRQKDICTMTFEVNEETSNFDLGTKLNFSHFYPAGCLLGVTNTNDTLFVISEVCYLKANNNGENLTTTQHGNISLTTTIGADDLTPFGFPETQPLDVYYSKSGSEIWHYLGPAGTTLQTNKLGTFMMGTSIKNDVIAPNITAEYNKSMGLISLNVKDNIGIRTSSLSVTVNGVQKEVEIINESSFNVYLTEQELKYMMTVLVTVNDLAGNQGRLFEMYNLDMPTGIEAIAADNNTDDNTTVKVSHRQLNITGAEAHATIHVFSMKGDLVATAQTDDEGCATIKLTMQPNGLYVFTISSGKSGKIVLK